MNLNPANTTRYIPRHVARPYVPRHSAPGLLSQLPARFRAAVLWIARKADEPMSPAMMCVCGAILGLLWAPLLLYCYFG